MNDTHRIQFEKPDLALLTRRFSVVDMHFHSHYSDGLNSIPKIADRARRLGIGLALTDHNAIGGVLELERYEDLFTIPGIELTSKEGTHLLVYFYAVNRLRQFYDQEIRPAMGSGVMSSLALPMEELVHRARDYETVIIFPHPFCAAYTGICNLQFPPERLEALCDVVDGVEAINAGNIAKWNLKSAVFGFNLAKSVTGGSDGHAINHMGKAITYADCQPNRRAFLNAVRDGQSRVIGKEIDLFRRVTSNGLRLRNNLNNYPDLIEKNIKYSYALFNSKSQSIKDSVKRRIAAMR
ncbi:MAG: PHP domain-containing protein [Desulfosarcinaceae bacterium]|nr:PHP domain-containing protein [Desulfosarcinaceae bacterium]